MNTLLLLVGLRPWRAESWISMLTKVFLAISVVSVEMQIATWLHVASLRTLPALNAALAFVAWRPARVRESSSVAGLVQPVPLPAVLLAALVVVALNVGMPLRAADTYHVAKLERIAQVGTLDYGPKADTKINVLSSVYEMVLADLRIVPLVGSMLVRLHGLWFLLLYLVAIGAVRELFEAETGWSWAVLLVVPVAFHQLVLVKNDLFVAVPALAVLAWVVTRSRSASWQDVLWASWLAGLVVAVKLTSLSLLLIVAAAVVVRRRERWRLVAAAAVGTCLGLLAGGLLFTLVQNVRVYDAVMPVADVGGGNSTLGSAAVSAWRFAISLFDLGLLTRRWWPGRGGWGGTFGLPLVWSLIVLVSSWRVPEARRTLLVAGVSFAAFAVAFADADLAQRLVLAPGLLLIAVAVHLTARRRNSRGWVNPALAAVMLVSAVQIARSAVLYFVRP